MPTWQEKQTKKAEFALEKDLQSGGNNFNEGLVAQDVRDAAMGKGDEELFEKKLTKEEKKALAKKKREAKRRVSAVLCCVGNSPSMLVVLCEFCAYVSIVLNNVYPSGQGRRKTQV